MAAPLTGKQAEIYEFILSFTKDHGYPPSVREISAAVNLKSPSTVHFHMKKLEAEGYIQKDGGKTRAISLPREAVAEELDGVADRVPLVGSVTWLMPENPDYQPIDGEGCSLLGKVAAVLRRYN